MTEAIDGKLAAVTVGCPSIRVRHGPCWHQHPEGGAQQYTSMAIERTIVDRVKRAPGFVQMFPSSEVTPALTALGLSPTLLHRAITSGEIAKKSRGASAAA